jgi:two-component system cell cycle sensor histidine kinase/response regulator CckA
LAGAQHGVTVTGSPISVLNVSAREPLRSVRLRALLQAGFRVTEAAGGHEALKAAIEKQPDVVVLDAALPDISGAEVANRLKSDPATAAIPIVQVSAGRRDPSGSVADSGRGADEYLAESDESELLVPMIRILARARRLEEAERELNHRVRQFEWLCETAPIGIAIAEDPACQSIRMNAALVRLLGMPPGESSPGSVPAAIYRVMRGGEGGCDAGAVEVDIVRPDGAVRNILARVSPTFEEQGEGRGTIGVFLDITERRRAEAEVRKNEARLARAHRMASLGHWELDPVTLELEWSDEVYRMYGLRKEDFRLTRESFYERLPPEDRDLCRAAMARTLREGKPYNIDHRVVLPDGGYRVVREHAEATVTETGAARVIGTVQDITEYRRLEEQLLGAQKLESVGRLAGGIAHDFNNLLTVIIGYSDLVLGQLERSHPAWAGIAEVKKAGHRASDLTRQLLAFSRRHTIELRVISLNAIITEAGKMLRRLMGEDVAISTILEPGLWPVKGDTGLLQQVLMNLVVNARDAMPDGGELTIETKNVDVTADEAERYLGMTPGPHVLLAVSDTGCGMDEAVRARIFEPFFTTKPKGAGTGLGLATCYGIVTQSGGWIGAHSEPGKGSTFRIYLPRTTEDMPAGEVTAAAGKAAGGSETILVVEDQPEVRRFACTVLRGQGYTVLEASGGEEALRILTEAAGPIHLMVTDLVMPGMTGRQLADRVRALYPSLRTLFMSGYSDEVASRHGVLEPGTAYLQKPFSPKALAEKVRKILDGAAER